MKKEKTYTILVMQDGETYGPLDGCKILTITEDGHELLSNGWEPDQLEEKDILSERDVQELVDKVDFDFDD